MWQSLRKTASRTTALVIAALVIGMVLLAFAPMTPDYPIRLTSVAEDAWLLEREIRGTTAIGLGGIGTDVSYYFGDSIGHRRLNGVRPPAAIRMTGGWPWRAVGVDFIPANGRDTDLTARPRPWDSAKWRRSRVLFPGLLGNVVVYAVILCCLACWVRRARTRYRIANSKCPSCAYQLQSSAPGCPECGLGRAV